MSFRVQIRRDPSDKWIVNNPILLSGEFGYETDTTFLKIGDGVTPWNYLPHWEGGQGPVGPTGSTGITGPTGSVLPYKVYTALLTQTGGDNLQVLTFPLLLAIGRSYKIINNAASADFTNVGAPNNNINTYFVATGETPAQWGEGELEYNTGAPEVKVLENTIGNIWLTYVSDGFYYINSNGLFTENKSWTPTIQIFNDSAGLRDGEVCEIRPNGSSEYYISTFDQNGAGVNYSLANTPMEIRVYN